MRFLKYALVSCITILQITCFAAGSPSSDAEGPGSGSGNNSTLARFFQTGSLTMAELEHFPNFIRPDGEKLSSAPIIRMWRDLMRNPERLKPSERPIYDAYHRRVGVRLDPVTKVSEFEWGWAERGYAEKAEFSLDVAFVFRIVLGQLALEKPEYEDIDRLLSTSLAKLVSKSVSEGFERLENLIRFPPSEQALKLFKLLKALEPQSKNTSTPIKNVAVYKVSCMHETTARSKYSCRLLYSSYEKPQWVRVSNDRAQAIFDMVLKLAPPSILGVAEGVEFFRFNSLDCSRVQNSSKSEAECTADGSSFHEPYGTFTAKQMDPVSFLRLVGRTAFFQAGNMNLKNSSQEDLSINLLKEIWDKIESGEIGLQMTDKDLIDKDGRPADAISEIADAKISISEKKWGQDPFYSHEVLGMILHEVLRFAAGQDSRYEDGNFSISRPLALLLWPNVKRSLARLRGQEVMTDGAIAKKLFLALVSAGQRPAKTAAGKKEMIVVEDLTCTNHHSREDNDYSSLCRSASELSPIKLQGQLVSSQLFDLTYGLGMQSSYGEDAEDLNVNKIICLHEPATGTYQCRLRQNADEYTSLRP